MSVRKIFVEGLAADTDEETVILQFENWRIGGGDVESVQLIGHGAAYVTFEDPSVAQAFLANSVVESSGLHLRISESQSSSLGRKDSTDSQDSAAETYLGGPTLQVEASPSLPSEDLLVIYFESKRASGGEIEELILTDNGQSATIVFKDPKVIWDILKREHKIGTTKLHVYALESLFELDGVQSCAIEATGIPKHLNEDLVVMFFESRRHFDGDTVDAICYDQSNGTAVLTYETPEVALRASKRQSVILDGQNVLVNLLQPMPPPPIVVGKMDPIRLLAKYLPVSCNDSEIAEYLQKPSGRDVRKVSRSRHPSVAVIVFSGEPDYIGCRRHVTMRPFRGRMISIQRVSLCSQIIIFPLVSSILDDEVLLHFESPRYGGSTIRNYSFNRIDGYVVICYEDTTVIDRVVQKEHSIEGSKLKADYYIEDLGPPPEALNSSTTAEHVQSPVEVISVLDVVIECDPKIAQFLMKSKALRTQIDTELANHQCSVVWPKYSDVEAIVLKCRTSAAEFPRRFCVDEWTKTCTNLLNKYIGRIAVGRLDIPKEIGTKFTSEAVGLQDEDGNLIWKISQTGDNLQFVGQKENVEIFIGKVRKLTEKLMEDLREEKEIVTDLIDKLTQAQLKILRMCDFDRQDESSTLKIDIADQAVAFEGTRQEVQEAKIKLYECINQVTFETYSASSFKLSALQDPGILNFIERSFKERGIGAVAEAKRGEMRLHGLGLNEIDQAVRFLDSEFLEYKVKLDKTSVTVLTIPQWPEALKKLRSNYPVVVVEVSPSQDALLCLSTKDNLEKVVDDIENIIQSNIRTEEFLLVSKEKLRYMCDYMKSEIYSIQCHLSSENTSIFLEPNGANAGIRIAGSLCGVSTALERVKKLVNSVSSYDDANDISEVLKSFSASREMVSSNEWEHHLKDIREMKDSEVDARSSSSDLVLPAAAEMKEKGLVMRSPTTPVGIATNLDRTQVEKFTTLDINVEQRFTKDSENETHDADLEVVRYKYKEHPGLIQKVNQHAKQHSAIWGLTILDNELFVVKWLSSEVEVYDATDFSLIRQWKSKELYLPGDIASCSQNNCLYVMDYNGILDTKKIVRFDPHGKVQKVWHLKYYEWGRLSVAKDASVILTVVWTHRLNEYTSDGHLIRTIRLPSEIDVNNPCHAIKLANSDFVISHGYHANDSFNGVFVMDANGKIKKSFDGESCGRMNCPNYLAVDEEGFVIVADRENGRVLVLNSDLEFQKELLSSQQFQLRHPWRIQLDESNGRLFVATNDWNPMLNIWDRGQILVFEIK